MVFDMLDQVWKFKTWPFLCHLHVLCKKSCFIFSLYPAVLRVWVWSLTMLIHCRRTGNFLPGGGGGGVNHLPKKFSQVAQIFTKQSKRNEGHKMQQHRPLMK